MESLGLANNSDQSITSMVEEANHSYADGKLCVGDMGLQIL